MTVILNLLEQHIDLIAATGLAVTALACFVIAFFQGRNLRLQRDRLQAEVLELNGNVAFERERSSRLQAELDIVRTASTTLRTELVNQQKRATEFQAELTRELEAAKTEVYEFQQHNLQEENVNSESFLFGELSERECSLTPRELQVYQLLGEGMANKDIAPKLGISPKTLDIHRANVMRKMNAKTIGQLVRVYCMERRCSENGDSAS